MYGWIFGKNVIVAEQENWRKEQREGYQFSGRLLNKFPDDIVNRVQATYDCFLDGYVVNKPELMNGSGQASWQETFSNLRMPEELGSLRGAFCGFIYRHDQDEVTIYTDQMGNRAVYYYSVDDRVIVSTNVLKIVQVLKENKLSYHVDENAVRYMLTYGFMIDDTTFVKEIKRVLPGQFILIKDKKICENVYYRIDNRNVQQCSKEEAVEKIDATFRQSVRREFEKDREYGYRHLVDLSGGLDSRMVCWVAHDMGYQDQLNFTYCRSGYMDFTISERIAMDLKHDYLFKPLDDIRWMYEIDEIVEKNNGAALYHGITGGKRLLELLDTNSFGIEHTGMVGDVIPSSFYHDEMDAYGKPSFGKHQYSQKLHYDFDETILQAFPNQEVFALFTRGLLGAASSYMTRQNYFETASPFLDVDFFDTCMSIPFEYRKNHDVYLEWIRRKYPEASEYGWEKWGGVKPKKTHIKYRKMVTAVRLADIYIRKFIGRAEKNYMNPLDYWFERDSELQQYYQEYFDENFNRAVISQRLKDDMKRLFDHGTIYEKGMVLTVLGAVKMYF